MAGRRHQVVRDPIVDWIGEGSPGWIALGAWLLTWVGWTGAVVVAAVRDPELGWHGSWVFGIAGVMLVVLLLAVALPVWAVTALIALAGRQLAVRVGELMVLVAVADVVFVVTWATRLS